MGFFRRKQTLYSVVLGRPEGNGWQTDFLSTPDVVAITETGLVASGPRTAVLGGRYGAFPAPFADGLDGALQLPPNGPYAMYMLFSGDQAIIYEERRGRITPEGGTWQRMGSLAATQYKSLGSLLPAAWSSDLDALMQAPPDPATGEWRTYFFKGARVMTLDWTNGVLRDVPITDGPDAGQAGWASLPAEFQSDLDHVAALAPAADGTRRSLLIKGPRGAILNWATGVETSGDLGSLNPGLTQLRDEGFAMRVYPVSGRYTFQKDACSVELRVDIDGPNASMMVSGDVYITMNGIRYYTNSFRVRPTLVFNQYVTVPVQNIEMANGAQGKIYLLLLRVLPRDDSRREMSLALIQGDGYIDFDSGRWDSPYMRTIDYEVDTVAGSGAFTQYDTSVRAVPPGYRNRVLTIPSTFAEAGIELRPAGQSNTLPTTWAGSDLRWSDAELHAAMLANYSLYRDAPNWALWVLACGFSERGSNFLGVMFDQSGPQRQGLAVFEGALASPQMYGAHPATRVHTYVHEIGHALNLLHSWQKDLATPPAPLGPNLGYGDLSWMNYPQNYQLPNGGSNAQRAAAADAFWAAFPFRFSDSELQHLRHAFLGYVIPGGAKFMGGAALDADAAAASFGAPVAEETGLRLELQGATTFEYGEPVVVQIKLARTGGRGDVAVTPHLHPSAGAVALAITNPAGTTRVFRPLVNACHGHGDDQATTLLTEQNPAVYESAYIGYGGAGLYFGEPGRYTITAAYHGPDGSRTVASSRAILVRHPLTRTDQHVGELLLDDAQGQLLTLLGSDAPQLQSGNDALQEVVERYGSHPLATYARLARGANAGRHFQRIEGSQVLVREADIKESVQQLGAVVSASAGDEGVDNITLNETMRRLARVHAKDGNLAEADAVLDRMIDVFTAKNLPDTVQATIADQAEEARNRIHETNG
ncbi:hypothetical protein [Embleya sp. NPDC005575]|uniref:hypothetical protein n=1 Tax=Embleya sp. NPDC005575 TaxID=3156892 RepID=UPI0033AB73FC